MADTDLDLSPAMFRSGQTVKKTTIQMQRRLQGVVNVEVPYTEVDGLALFEGDIVLATVEQVKDAEAAAEAKGIGIVGDQFRWPGGKVPFVIAAQNVRARAEAAIKHWQERTPFKFTPRNGETDFISFESLNGCFSHVGRQGGKQVISLGTGCELGAAIHEIGHALGAWHEQSRSDRDTFVDIFKDNIDPSMLHNFDKHILDGKDLGAYDHGSIMHYPERAFSINGKPTIVAKNGASIGQRTGLSKGDIGAMRLMYPDLDWAPFDTE
jgi:hypothetical protein